MNKYIELINKLKEIILKEETISNQYQIIYNEEVERCNLLKNEIESLNEELKVKERDLSILEYYKKNRIKLILSAILIALIVASMGSAFFSMVLTGDSLSVLFTTISVSLAAGIGISVSWFNSFTVKMRALNEKCTIGLLKYEIIEKQNALIKKKKRLKTSTLMTESYGEEIKNLITNIDELKEYVEYLTERVLNILTVVENNQEINRIFEYDKETQEIVKLTREKVEK